jgi:hypothetical protein
MTSKASSAHPMEAAINARRAWEGATRHQPIRPASETVKAVVLAEEADMATKLRAGTARRQGDAVREYG